MWLYEQQDGRKMWPLLYDPLQTWIPLKPAAPVQINPTHGHVTRTSRLLCLSLRRPDSSLCLRHLLSSALPVCAHSCFCAGDLQASSLNVNQLVFLLAQSSSDSFRAQGVCLLLYVVLSCDQLLSCQDITSNSVMHPSSPAVSLPSLGKP